jgi:hypothetical protein
MMARGYVSYGLGRAPGYDASLALAREGGAEWFS